MTVAELIKALEAMPQDADAWVQIGTDDHRDILTIEMKDGDVLIGIESGQRDIDRW